MNTCRFKFLRINSYIVILCLLQNKYLYRFHTQMYIFRLSVGCGLDDARAICTTSDRRMLYSSCVLQRMLIQTVHAYTSFKNDSYVIIIPINCLYVTVNASFTRVIEFIKYASDKITVVSTTPSYVIKMRLI